MKNIPPKTTELPNMKRFSILILVATMAVGSYAQSLTLEQAQSLARDNYPQVKRYGLIEQTAQFTLSNIAKGWLPSHTRAMWCRCPTD